MEDSNLPSGQPEPPSPSIDGAGAGSAKSASAPRSYEGLVEPAGLLATRSVWISYLFAAVLTAGAVGLRRSIDVLGSDVPPFVVFYPVVLICTLYGGVGPGVLSMTIAAVAASYLWLEPHDLFALAGKDLVAFALFIASNAVNIYVADRLRAAHARIRKSEARLSLSQDVGRIGIWDLDLRTGAVWWSPSFYKVTRISPDQPPSIDAVIERIHRDDRKRAVQLFEEARAGNNRLDLEFRFHCDNGETIWLAGRAELFRDSQGRPTRLLGINFDATPIRTAESQRDQANALLKTFFDSLPGAAFAKNCEGRYLIGNPIFAAAMGHEETSFSGRTDLELLADADQARAIMANDQAIIASGAPRQVEEALLLPDGKQSYWLGVKAPFFDAEGTPQGIIGISLDVTDRRKAEERLRFLADEVDHRAKNLLGVVLSLVRLTKVDDVVAFKAAVSGRIQALARAHTLLAANRWQGVNIVTLLREEIAPFGRVGSERIRLEGPPLLLEPNAAQALAMAMHELAINAAMHGALSAEEGRLDVTWEVIGGTAGSWLSLSWREAGGPVVAAPNAPGFGSTAIRGAIEHQLGGTLDLEWAPSGVACRIAFPLANDALGDRATLAAEPDDPPAPPIVEAVALEGKRVLILEDEALIALTLMDAVRELGCTIVGPSSTVDAALDLVGQKPLDLAILDVNLAGTSSAPVAQALRARGVPFVYCTGYAEPALQIDPALMAPMLTKPIDTRALAEALRGAASKQPATCP